MSVHPTRIFKGTLAALLAALLASGCAATSITSSRDPAFDSVNFKRIAVLSTETGPQQRGEIEATMVEMLRKRNISATRASLLTPLVESPSVKEVSEQLQAQSYQAVLVVRVIGSGVNHDRAPMAMPGSSLQASGYGALNNPTSALPPDERVTSKHWADYGMWLIELQSGKVVWHSRARATGDGYAPASAVLSSFAESAAQELKKSGLVLASST